MPKPNEHDEQEPIPTEETKEAQERETLREEELDSIADKVSGKLAEHLSKAVTEREAAAEEATDTEEPEEEEEEKATFLGIGALPVAIVGVVFLAGAAYVLTNRPIPNGSAQGAENAG
jgi:hypothetical protein